MKLIKKLKLSRGCILGSVLGLACLLSGCGETSTQLKNRAERGDLEALVTLGNAYLEGDYEGEILPYRPEEALRLYHKAAIQSHPRGMKKYGWCLLKGTGTPPDPWQGLRWIWRACREEYRDRKKTLAQLEDESFAGVAKSQYRLAVFCRNGQWVNPDPARALKLFEQAARVDYADSRFQAVQLRAQWIIFQKTEARAQQGDAAAMISYAKYLEGQDILSGLKIKVDEAKARDYLEKSSRKSPEGKMALAQYLLRKDPSAVDRARKLFRESAQAGCSPAIEFIAGLGGETKAPDGGDLFSARESWRACEELAKADARSAQVLLAKKYLAGQGIPDSPAQAIPWLKRAATPKENEAGLFGILVSGMFGPDRGDAEAQFLLGCCYRDGVGVKKNTAEAIRWFNFASQNRSEEARTALASMRLP